MIWSFSNIQKLIHLNVDGILISSIAVTEDRDILSRHRYPLLAWLRGYEDGISIIDDDYNVENVWENISEAGHKNVGYI
ncbi:MAG: hypothetical protein ACLRMZ_24240 [Blautia marasmi]